MVALAQGMKLALYAHTAHFFPRLHRIHGSPAIGITVDKEHRSRHTVEAELGHKYGTVVVPASGVVIVQTVSQRIRRINTYAPLHVAWQTVNIVNRQIRPMHGRGHPHKSEMPPGRTSHNAYLARVKPEGNSLASYNTYGTLQILPCSSVLGETLGTYSFSSPTYIS